MRVLNEANKKMFPKDVKRIQYFVFPKTEQNIARPIRITRYYQYFDVGTLHFPVIPGGIVPPESVSRSASFFGILWERLLLPYLYFNFVQVLPEGITRPGQLSPTLAICQVAK